MEEKVRIRNECEINVCSIIILNTDFRAEECFFSSFFQPQSGSSIKVTPDKCPALDYSSQLCLDLLPINQFFRFLLLVEIIMQISKVN